MSDNQSASPAGITHLSPYLCVDDAAAAIEFYKTVFGAVETMRLTEPNGKVGHAEIKIGDALIMLSDEYPEYDARGPKSLGGTPVKLHLYVPDVDAVAERAENAGGTITRAVEDQFYGDRSGQFRDPFGHIWLISTHKEDITNEEMQRRYDESMND